MKKLKFGLYALALTTTLNTAIALEVSVSNNNQNNAGFDARLNSLLAEIEALRGLLTSSNEKILQLEQNILQNTTKITNTETTTNKHYKQIQSNTTRITNLEKKVNTTITTPSTPAKMYWRPTGQTDRGSSCSRSTSYPTKYKYIKVGTSCTIKNAYGYYDKSSYKCGTDKDRGTAKVAICE